MAKKKMHTKRKMTIPMAVVVGMAPGIGTVYAHRGGGLEEMSAEASRVYLGYAGTNKFGYNDQVGFHPYLLKFGTGPILAGLLVHQFANRLGLNRVLAQSGIPLVRI